MSATSPHPSTVAAVRRFAELSKRDVEFGGGKGANLGELTRAGLPVPPGFVIGAPAYDAFCEAGGLRERIAAELDGLDVDDTAALGQTSRRVRQMIAEEPMPDWLEREIRSAYTELSGEDRAAAVAVRSSATAEDTESASFAGMNETFLNVRGADGLIDAVRRCWASLFGGRTVFYRAKRGFSQAGMDIAVVVQRQIASTRSGVMFTVDPSTGRADRIVIEGSFGLGEAVVSGSVSPDSRVRGEDRTPLRRSAGHRMGVRRERRCLDAAVAPGHIGRPPAGRRGAPARSRVARA
jgi:pyruvate, water dikinase